MPSSPRALEYRLSFPAPWTHLVDVSLRIPQGGDLELWMPVWTPGSYLVREYSRHVQDLAAFDPGGNPLPVAKTRKNRWKVSAGTAPAVEVRYRVYGREMTVRTNWIDGEFALLNGAATFITVKGYESSPHRVSLDLPRAWAGAWTSMTPETSPAGGAESGTPGGAQVFTAAGVDELVDSPILAGNPAVHDFRVQDKPVSLVDVGESGLWDGAEAARHTEAIVNAYARMMGTLPFDRYLFFNLIAEGRGGLEHKKSSVLLTSRYAYRRRKTYMDWLGLVSHEFFHVWNVKRLRPAALGPFDYENEVYTRSLWVAEGVTEYYTDLTPCRAGLTTPEEYLGLLSQILVKVETSPGRLRHSLEEASFDAWIKLYRPDENTANTTVSYYMKGAVVAWFLDAVIRESTGGARSLDDWMRLLFERFSGERGFTDAEIQASAEEVAGRPLGGFFDACVRGRGELEYQPVLRCFGLRFRPAGEGLGENAPPVWLGMETTVSNGKLVVTSVREDGPARAAGLSAEDEILALGGFRVDGKTFPERLHQFRAGERVEVLIARRDAVRIVPVTLAPAPGEPWRLEIDPDAPAEAAARRGAWLWRNESR